MGPESSQIIPASLVNPLGNSVRGLCYFKLLGITVGRDTESSDGPKHHGAIRRAKVLGSMAVTIAKYRGFDDVKALARVVPDATQDVPPDDGS